MGKALDDFIARTGGGPAKEQGDPQNYDSWIGGAISSAVSGLPEMFGVNPTAAAEEFRNRNPVSGFVSEIAPMLLSGVGSELAVTKIPRLAKLADAGVAGLGLAAETTPIRAAAARAFAGQLPLSAAQLGGGAVLADEGNYGNVMADVGLNQVGAGILGGGFGWLARSGGAGQLGEAGRYMGMDSMASPMYQFRAAKEAGETAAFTGRQDLETNLLNLRNEAIGERPGTQFELVGGTKDNNRRLNGLFKVNGKPANGWDVRGFIEGADDDLSKLDIGQREPLTKAAGFQDIDDLAAHLQHPTVVTMADDVGASKMNNLLKGKGITSADDNVWMGMDQDGHALMIKRVNSTAANETAEGATKTKTHGPMQIAEGDKFIVGRTDTPGKLVPEGQKLAELNASSWGKVKSAYRTEFGKDVFSQRENEMIKSMGPEDLQDMGKLSKRTWVGKKMKEMTDNGLPVSESARSAFERVHDVFAPAVRRELGDPVYGRLMGMLRGRMEHADGLAGKMVYGAVKTAGSGFKALGKGLSRTAEGLHGNRTFSSVVNELNQEELNALETVINGHVSPDQLGKVLTEEQITPRLKAAVAELQKQNKDYIEKVFIPTLKGTDAERQLSNLQDHFILPREMQGSWGTVLRDENGVEKFYLGGENRTVVESRAQAVINEAAERGKTLKADKAEAVIRKGPAAMSDLSDKLAKQLDSAPEEDTLDIVQTALKKWQAAQYAPRGGMKATKKLGRLQKGTNRTLAPEVRDVKSNDLIDRAHRHYTDLNRFAGYQGWRTRFKGEIEGVKKVNPLLHENLERKGNQYMGIEGDWTKFVDSKLSSVFGSALGGKAASTIARTTNSALFMWNQGILNPTASIVNLAGIFQNLLPMVSFLSRATPETMMKYMQIGPIANAAGKVVGVSGTLEPMRVMRAGWKLLKDPDLMPGFREHLNRAIDENVLVNGTDEFVGEKSRQASSLRELYTNAGGGANGGWEFAKGAMTWMTRKSEELPRLLSFSTLYHMGTDLGLEGDTLYRFARNGTRRAMYGYSVVDRSRILTGPLGSMFGLFKNYAFHYMDNMASYAGLAVNEGIWDPLLWQVGSTFAVGGLGATPLHYLSDGLANWHDDSPDSYAWMQQNWPKASDAIYFGLPAFLGVSLQSSAMMPGTDVTQDVGNLTNSVVVDRMLGIGKSVGEAWQYADATGDNPLANSNIRDQLLNAFAPRALSKAASVLGGEHIKSMSTGYPGVENASSMARVAQFMGFNPIEQARSQVVGRQLWNKTNETKAAVEGYGMQLAQAIMEGDFDTSSSVMQEAAMAGVDLGSVSSSAHTRMARERKGSLSRYGPEALRQYAIDQAGQLTDR